MIAKRWNKNWSKAFDVASAPLEPASLAYDWISRYLGVPVKLVYTTGKSISGARMGSWLTGLENSVSKSWKLDDVRNIDYAGTERPPEYDVIQLNSTRSNTFLVEGYAFYKSKVADQPNFVLRFSPTWGGLNVRIWVEHSNAQKANDLFQEATRWAKEHNFLKGEAFSLSGEFLPKTEEVWGSLFLEPKNEKALTQVAKRMNEKQLEFSNHGMILCGPPGTGKTLSGRILRNDCNASFVWVSARDFYYSGAFGGLSQAWDLAKELAPSIVFIEDVDNWLDRHTVDYIKTEMDGMARSTGVLTILTTNFPEQLPKALIDRPGRFNDVLYFGLPEKAQRQFMIEKWLPGTEEVVLEKAVSQTKGFAGAHIYHLCQYAKNLEEVENVQRSESISLAIKKVVEQRQLIDDIQLQGSRYQPTKELKTNVEIFLKGTPLSNTKKTPEEDAISFMAMLMKGEYPTWATLKTLKRELDFVLAKLGKRS